MITQEELAGDFTEHGTSIDSYDVGSHDAICRYSCFPKTTFSKFFMRGHFFSGEQRHVAFWPESTTVAMHTGISEFHDLSALCYLTWCCRCSVLLVA